MAGAVPVRIDQIAKGIPGTSKLIVTLTILDDATAKAEGRTPGTTDFQAVVRHDLRFRAVARVRKGWLCEAVYPDL